MRWLASLLFFVILRWQITGKLPPEIKKAVIVVAPHTSWHDFFIGAFVRKIIRLPINFIAKKELFDSPFGWYFKWMGGAPVERSKTKNQVEQVTEIFKQRNEFRLAMAPEGTRKKVSTWKTGFYYIALKAGVPVICVAFDYGSKTVKIREPFYPTGSYERDFLEIKEFYKDVVGKVPEYT